MADAAWCSRKAPDQAHNCSMPTIRTGAVSTPPKVEPTQAELSDISNLQHAGPGKQKKASRSNGTVPDELRAAAQAAEPEQQAAQQVMAASEQLRASQRAAALHNHRHGSRSLSEEAAFVLHAVALLLYVRVWLWHLTPAAYKLPGATGFGWFFRYLTFYSFSLQMVTLFICCLADLAQDPQRKLWLEDWADDLSCALFSLANVVTGMYYMIDAATGRDALVVAGLLVASATVTDVEGGDIARPSWLGFAVHLFNSAVAWTDILIAHPRSFSRRSERISLGLILFFTLWILLCSYFNGAFPYPFLNALPWPQGFIGVASAAVVLFWCLFHGGRLLCTRVLQKRIKLE